MKIICKSYDQHMENENENTIINKEENNSKQTEKVRGEKENLFICLNENEILNSIEYLDRINQTKFKPPELNNFFQAFKIQYNKDFYSSRSEVIKHFRNWLKNNHKPINGHSKQETKTERRLL